MLAFIGIGFSEKDLSYGAAEIISECGEVYFDSYTSIFEDMEGLGKIIKKKIIPLGRDKLESDFLVEKARKSNVALLIAGDPFAATTHIQLLLDCVKNKIPFKISHGPSIISSLGETGLQPYKFGRIISVPMPEEGYSPVSHFKNIEENHKAGLHSLLLLDLHLKVNDVLESLTKNLSFIDENSKVLVIARLGMSSQVIKYSSIKKLIKTDFGEPPYSVIIPGELHFVEKECLETLRKP